MRPSIFFFVTFLLLFYNCTSLKKIEPAELTHQHKPFVNQSSPNISLENLKIKYDTLIPIFNGLFITNSRIDSVYYFEKSKDYEMNFTESQFIGEHLTIQSKKWGVIDSVGNVIVPFMCDGAKQISENEGIVSVYSTSYSLNTGIPRYQYKGMSYVFNKEGIVYTTKKEFSIKIEFIADFHHTIFVIQKGPHFYLPSEYRIINY
jgi:hypothetical protein